MIQTIFTNWSGHKTLVYDASVVSIRMKTVFHVFKHKKCDYFLGKTYY